MTVEVAEVAQGVLRIDCGQVPVFLHPQVAYLVIGDEASALVEPGCTTSATRLLNEEGQLGLDMNSVSYIIPTHIHVDHAGGIGFLMQHMPGARAVLHPKGALHMKDPSRVIRGTGLAFGDTWEEHFGPILPVPEDRILVVEDGDAISLGNRNLTTVFTPGHAPHHISVLDSLPHDSIEGKRALLRQPDHSVVLIPPLPYEVRVEYLLRRQSLQLLHAL